MKQPIVFCFYFSVLDRHVSPNVVNHYVVLKLKNSVGGEGVPLLKTRLEKAGHADICKGSDTFGKRLVPLLWLANRGVTLPRESR